MLQLRPHARLPRVPVHEEHDPQGIRRRVQGHLRRGVRHRIQDAFRAGGPDVRAPPDRRHGGQLAQVARRLCVGMQELRRRCAVRHRGPRLRVARPDDLCADDAGRADGRSRGCTRHGDAPLSPLAEGRKDLDEPDRLNLRVDRRPQAPREARRHPSGGRLRRNP